MNSFDDRAFMRMADEQQALSTCAASKFGCVIVKYGKVLSKGHNGRCDGYSWTLFDRSGAFREHTMPLHKDSDDLPRQGTKDSGWVYIRRACNVGACDRCRRRALGELKSGEGLEKCICMHAEVYALRDIDDCMDIYNYNEPPEDDMNGYLFGFSDKPLTDPRHATLYTQMVPCEFCAAAIVRYKIARVVVKSDDYPRSGKHILASAGIRVDVIGD